MLKKITKLNHIMENIKRPVEYNLEPYKEVLEKINKINLNTSSDERLKEMSQELLKRARNGVSIDKLLIESFALVRESSQRVLGMYPYDVQVMAGIALHKGKIVEMKTGEGKTLAAIMPGYLNALSGKGVHILTFNDYLAKRDAQWMGPVFSFLGLTVGYVNEGMSVTERKKAYSRDITYVTAKEAGFDYLRDFLCTEKESLIHSSFNYAIVDEADSILIDEARIPLVIAGNVSGKDDISIDLARMVKELRQDHDYEIDEYQKNVTLTDDGLENVEEILGRGNLYNPNNLELLTSLNCALHAQALLQKDRDYIVRNNRIEIIDEFTGRIADNRHWPDNLQIAVEAKEGLTPESKGKMMGSIALQYFLNLYPKISGMTGTATTEAEEFREFYSMDVVVIPTNKPCIRKDHPDMIFTHKEAKLKALVAEIKRVQKTGQPILIGTASVQESENLASDLEKAGITCQVLNAKNDEMEAMVVLKAGELGSVTVSTNMAGRGVDIKLGGEKGESRQRVIELGGLYVIGTNRHESRRIDNQLRGRSGRQGDPGESRFFISLEDDLFKKYNVLKYMTLNKYSQSQEEPIDNPIAIKDVDMAQRIVQGYNSDTRRQLWKYSYIIEQQRRIIHSRHRAILSDQASTSLLAEKGFQRYSQFDKGILRKVEKQLTLFYINKHWAEYLDYIGSIRESIHLVVIGKKNPLDEFHRFAIDAFDDMMDKIDEEIIDAFYNVDIGENGIDMEKEGFRGPSATWTYLIDDSPDQFSNLANLIKSVTETVTRPVNIFRIIYNSIFRKK